MTLTIEDVLSRRVLTAAPGDTLADAARTMAGHRVSCLVVVRDDRPVGVLTEADLVRVGLDGHDPASLRVADFVAAPAVTVETGQTIYEAFDFLVEHRVRQLVAVREDGRLEGVLSFSDILGAAEFDDFMSAKPAEDVMTRNVVTARPDAPVREAMQRMAALRVSCVVAVDAGRAVGIFTERDVARLVAAGDPLAERTVGEVMSAPLLTMHRQAALVEVSATMREHGYRRLVIADDDGGPAGVVTQFDVIRGLAGSTVGRYRRLYAEAEARLDESRRLLAEKSELERVVEMSPAILYRCVWEGTGEDGHFVGRYASPALTDVLGYPREEYLRPGWWLENLHPEDRPGATALTARILDVGDVEHVYRFSSRSGEYRWIRDHARLVRGPDGEPRELVGSWLDVTESLAVETRATQTEVRFGTIAELAPVGIFTHAADGGCTYVNGHCARIVGRSPADCLGWGWAEAIHPEDRERIGRRWAESAAGRRPFREEYRFRHPDGAVRWVVGEARSLGPGGGGGFLGTVVDVTDLRESEQNYRSLFDDARDMIHMVAPDGTIADVNQVELETLGYSRDELVGRPVAQILCPSARDAALARVQDVLRGESMDRVETALHARDGTCIPVELSAMPRRVGGAVVGARAIIRDMRERRRRDRQLAVLAEAGRRVNETLDERRIGRALVTLARDLVDCESGAVGLLREGCIAFDEYLRKGEWMAIDLAFPPGFGVPGHVLEIREPYVSADALRDPHVIPEIQAALGFRKLADVPILDSAGALLGCFEMHDRMDGRAFDAQDVEMLQGLAAIVSAALVNARLLQREREAEASLRRSQRLYDEAQRIASLGHWVLELGGDRLTWSDEVFRIFEVDPARFEGTLDAFLRVVHPDDRETVKSVYGDAVRERRPYSLEHRLLLPDGRVKWVHERCETEYAPDGTPLRSLGTVLDITASRTSEEQLRLLRSAVAAVGESIFVTDAEGVILYVNPAFTRTTGFAQGEAVGRTPRLLNSGRQPAGFFERFWAAILAGQPWSGRLLDRRKDGTIFPAQLSVAPIFSTDGAASHFVAVLEDLTDVEEMQRRVMESQRMETVGTVVGGLAHDFNNMLAGMLGNLYMLRSQYRDHAKLVDRVERMEEAVEHGSGVIRQMLTFARRDRPQMRSLDLAALLAGMNDLLRGTLPESIDLRMRLPEAGAARVRGDATQLQQVLLNLVANARDAVRAAEGPQVCVALDLEPPPATLLEAGDTGAAGGWCRVRCTDNGAGMSPRTRERLFEPFFTTKSVGEGTGLGMSMAYGAVRSHSGLIDVRSEQGRGTTVSLWFPLSDAEEDKVDTSPGPAVDGRGRTVLVVDDEDGLRDVLAEMLELSGFEVLRAADGERAVEQFAQHRGRIDLVLMDVVMPVKGGVAAGIEIRAMDATIPILFQTGYEDETQLAGAGIANSETLHKPVRIPELLEKVAALLGLESG